ncbi:MAG: hypothetical protein Q9209_003069 [Squamulea sp. 1 TL-2023]
MSFRKRNEGLSGLSLQSQIQGSGSQSASAPGIRPSPLDGRPTTSTGTSSLDDLLGHSGLALGNAVLIEENGTTEFGATLLRYFAAEGVVQGHKVHVVGVGEPWGRELPGVTTAVIDHVTKPEAQTAAEKDRMKIAWRYERLGDFGAGPSSARCGTPVNLRLTRWMELLSDGVIELSPFPHSVGTGPTTTTSGSATAQEEKPQGMVKVHRLPVFSEKGGGGAVGDDLVFTVSRRKFVIKPFNLPPVEGDTEAQKEEGEGKPIKVDIDF